MLTLLRVNPYFSCEKGSQKVHSGKSSHARIESWFCCWCVMQIALFIPTTAESYAIDLSPTSHYGDAWSKPGMLAASHRAGWWGLSRLLFVCTLEPLFIQKHVLQGSTVALIVWSERALLSPGSDIMRVSALHMICSSLKQDTWNSPGPKKVQQAAPARRYTRSSSVWAGRGGEGNGISGTCERTHPFTTWTLAFQFHYFPGVQRGRLWVTAFVICIALPASEWSSDHAVFSYWDSICWRILSLSSRESGNQDRSYTSINKSVCPTNPQSAQFCYTWCIALPRRAN